LAYNYYLYDKIDFKQKLITSFFLVILEMAHMILSKAEKWGLIIGIVSLILVSFYLGLHFSSSEKDKLPDESNENKLIIDQQAKDINEKESLIKNLEYNLTIKDDEIEKLQGEKEGLQKQNGSLQETITQKDANISFLKQQNTNLQLVNSGKYVISFAFGIGVVGVLKLLRWVYRKYKERKEKYTKKESKGPKETVPENEVLISQRRTLDIEKYTK